LQPMPSILDQLESPILRRFFQYYLEKSGARPMPARRDLDPVDFPYALGDITLIDVAYDPLRFSFRLDGSRHVERFGFDLTGRSLDEFPYPEMRQAIFDSYREVVEAAIPHRLQKCRPESLHHHRSIEEYRCAERFATELHQRSLDLRAVNVIARNPRGEPRSKRSVCEHRNLGPKPRHQNAVARTGAARQIAG